MVKSSEAWLQDIVAQRRGRLKIFLGYAAGVWENLPNAGGGPYAAGCRG